MASAPIDVEVVVKGLASIKKLERQMEAIEKDVAALNRGLPRASNNIRSFGGAARQASAGFAALNKAMVKVAAVIAAIRGATFVFTSAAELESQAKSLEVLTGSAQKAGQVIKELQEFSAVTPFTSSELIDTTKRLKAFGVETEKLVKTTKILADVSGATGAKINEVALAYGQVQAKGKLQTEELYQLQERGIGIADELRRMYGLTGEEFVKALEKGQISAKAVEQAFINLTGESGKYFNGATAQAETLAGKWSTLIDAVTRLAQNIGQTLGPALKGILTLAINITNAIVGMIQKINQLLGIGTENAVAKLERDIESLEGRLGANGGRRDAINKAKIAAKKAELASLRAELEKTAAVTKEIDTNLPKLTGGNDDGSGSGTGKDPAEQEAKAAQQLKAAQDLLFVEQNRRMLLGEMTELERINAEGRVRELEIRRQFAELQANALSKEEEKLLLDAQSLALSNNQLEVETKRDELRKSALSGIEEEIALLQARLNGTEDIYQREKDIADLVKKGGGTVSRAEATKKVDTKNQLKNQLKELNKIKAKYEEIAKSFANAVASGLKNVLVTAIEGGDIQQAFSDMFSSLADVFLNIAFEQVAELLAKTITDSLTNGIDLAAQQAVAAQQTAAAGVMQGAALEQVIAGGEMVIAAKEMMAAAVIMAASGGIPGKASGGPVVGSKPYIVGENGPELFVPSESGTIVPNDYMASAMQKYSPGMEGAGAVDSAEGAGGEGGIGADAPPTINIEGGVMRFNDSDYIRQDQIPAIVSQASKQGEARAMRRLQMSPATRRKVGVR